VFARNHPHPRCELPPLAERPSVADSRDECGGREAVLNALKASSSGYGTLIRPSFDSCLATSSLRIFSM
jgi:hypothetical protein